jgi:two-component system cell cycle sensor histidine kinase/response regulator CckA
MRTLKALTLLGLLEESSHVYWVRDPKTMAVMYVNHAYESIWGRDRGSLYMSPLSFLDGVHPADRQKARLMFEKTMRYEPNSTEFRVVNPDGSVHWIRDRSFLIKNGSARDVYVAGIAEEITSSREQPRRVSHALGRKEFVLLAGGIAHDFNNVLTAVVGNGSSLLRDSTLPNNAHDKIKAVVHAGLLGKGLAKELMEFSKPVTSELFIVDLNELIYDLVPTLRDFVGRSVEVETSLASDVPIIRGDSDQLRRVVLNLVLNARDAMARGGRLTLTTCQGEAGDWGIQRRLPYQRPGRLAVMKVTDTGCGMDLATQAQIFKPFFTTKAEGVGCGLGLCIVKRIVHHHHGHMNVWSIKGEGTTFSIYFPDASLERLS